MIKKEKCESLEQVRDRIDQLDQELIELIATRQFYVDQAVRFIRMALMAPRHA